MVNRLDIETYQDTLCIRQVADDLFNRLRKLSHKRRQGKDLIAPGQSRCLQQIDNLDGILVFEVFFTDFLQIDKCSSGFWCLPRDIKPQIPLCRRRPIIDQERRAIIEQA